MSRTPSIRIPVAQPTLSGHEQQHVLAALAANQLSMGPLVARLEAQWRDATGCAYAIAVMNGTVGLHLPFAALGLRAGHDVLVPAMTYVASANAVAYTGARVVLCDVDPDTWVLTAQEAARRATHETVAVEPVHLFGVPADVDGLWDWVLTRPGMVHVIEDAAEAHGTRTRGQHVGKPGDAGVFSFFGNKTITCGEGGMVVTDDPDLYHAMCLLRGQGMDPKRRYFHPVLGHNYRMTELQAAVGVGQMETFHDRCRLRREVVEAYREALGGVAQFQAINPADAVVPWMAACLFPTAWHKEVVRTRLELHGIETRPFFTPLSEFPMYAADPSEFPVSYDLWQRGLVLPTWTHMPMSVVSEVCHHVLEALR